ncbi:MAG: ATP-binding protein [Candidatus Woesearchaeota archaeon]|nr:ATP-binding protein [Candidatus Woesearchaeota archaeon]
MFWTKRKVKTALNADKAALDEKPVVALKEKPAAVLEEKIEQAESKPSKAFNKIKIVERFLSADYSAQKVWEYLSKNGELKEIGETVNYDGKISGSPQMKRSEDNSLFPIIAAFKTILEKSEYIVNFKTSLYDGGLEVSIECDFDNVNHVNNLLSLAKKEKQEIVSISRKYDDIEPIRKLYDILSENKSMKIFASSINSTPKMIIDEEFGLLPVDAKVQATLEGNNYVFNFHSYYNSHEIIVECPPDKTDFVKKLFDSIAIRETEEGETEVRSLDFYVSVKEYHWDMVGGLKNVRKELKQYIEWPLENPELFRQLDSSMPKGVLLIGPPGNGKTTIAKILANETKSSFYAVSAKDINSMWVGGTEKNWGRLFRQAREDVKGGKCVIMFIDEIDGLYTDREEMDKYSRISFGQFCQEMEGISDLENVIVVGATNRHEDLDPALTRRFPKKIYIGNPDSAGRKEVFDIYTKKKPIADDLDIGYLVQATEGFSGARLKDLCDSAAFNAINRYSTTKGIEVKDIKGELIKEIVVEKQDFDLALSAEEHNGEESELSVATPSE